MDLIVYGFSGVFVLLALLALGVPIAFAMAFTGLAGLWIVEGPAPAMDSADGASTGAGELVSIGPPPPVGSATDPNDYGPAPAPVPVNTGPLEVSMSDLEFDRFAEPKYPRSRDARNKRGWVQLDFTVNADGSTSNVSVAESSPPGTFDEAAMSAARQWRFKPYVVDGEAVPVNSVVRLRFEPR